MHDHTKNFFQELGLAYPLIIQAPMAGGITTPELVAAVSNSGGLGSFATGYLTVKEAEAGIRAIQAITQRPFAVNLFVDSTGADVDPETYRNYQTQLNLFRQKLKLTPQKPTEQPVLPPDQLENLVNLLIELRIPIVSFTFGILPKHLIKKLQAQGIRLIGTATTLEEALLLEQAGVDAIVAQGHEAGGHRGGFTKSSETSSMGLMSLIPMLTDKIKIPIIAAGGIMDARGIVAALMLGACAVQMGTVFLPLAESGTNAIYRAELAKASQKLSDPTTMTSAYSGKAARGLVTPFTESFKNQKVPPYPIPHYLTKPLRATALTQKNPDVMSFWCGQGIGIFSAPKTVAELLQKMYTDIEKILTHLTKQGIHYASKL